MGSALYLEEEEDQLQIAQIKSVRPRLKDQALRDQEQDCNFWC